MFYFSLIGPNISFLKIVINSLVKIEELARCQGLMTVILTTQEAEIRRITV
jgi:hypothetical protein